MKIPGPDHPIEISRARGRWRVRYADHVIADSDAAVVLTEANHPPVVYFPRSDVSMDYLARTERITHCPYKGDAGYFSLLMDGALAENAVWTYEDPYPAVAEIVGRLAFYPDKVEVYEVDDAVVNPRHADRAAIDEAILHTDAGDGRSQREPWAPNVSIPKD
jgi:uncharacterized protein (DUF427 family)